MMSVGLTSENPSQAQLTTSFIFSGLKGSFEPSRFLTSIFSIERFYFTLTRIEDLMLNFVAVSRLTESSLKTP
jgi:hypothetical protein